MKATAKPVWWQLWRRDPGSFWLTVLFLILIAGFISGGSRAFATWPMYQSLLSTLPLFGVMALALTLVVASGEIDLCFPSTLAMSGLAFATTAIHTGLLWPAMIAAICTGLIIGVLNGLLVAFVGVPSIIATIGTQFFWRGVALLLSQGIALNLPEREGVTYEIFVGRIGEAFPMQALWMLALAIILWVILNRHPLGDSIRFTGENADIASRLGVNVPLARMGVHTLMGAAAGFAGALGCMEMGSWWPTQGEGYMLLVFAAVFIGGTSVFGGAGRIYGTLVGTVIVGMIEAGIVSAGISGFWTRTVHGLVIVSAVSCYALLSETTPSPLAAFFKRLSRQRPCSEQE